MRRAALNPLVGSGRRHADVGDDDLGLVFVDGGEQRVMIFGCGDDLVTLVFEHHSDTFAQDVGVVGQHDPSGHDCHLSA